MPKRTALTPEEVAAILATPPTKKCTGPCGEILDLEQFNRHRGMTGGRVARCKRCKAAYNRDNRAKRSARRFKWRNNNPLGMSHFWFNNIRRRCINTGVGKFGNVKMMPSLNKGIRLEFTKPELQAFVESQWPLILEIQGRGQKVNLGRRDTNGHYTIDNLRIIPSVGRQSTVVCASGFRGVKRTKSGKFEMRFTHKGELVYGGRYPTAEEAARAYDAKFRELNGPGCYQNFPQD